MSEWIKTTLNEIADVIGGGTPSTKNEAFWGGEIPWITPKDLTGYTKMYISHGERFITKNGLDNSSARLLPEGTVLMSSRAPIGYVAIAANPITTNQGFKSLVPNTELANNKFLYFWIKNNKQYIDSLGSGTTFAEVSGSVVKSLEIELPSLPEQKAIASVLSALDNKIDLLHRQNKTLESMAETLFRQWFVEEVQDDWEEKKFSDLFEIRDGTHDSPKQALRGYPLITSKHIDVWSLKFNDAYLISESDYDAVNKRSKVEQYDILFSMIGTLGRTYIESSDDINYAIKNIGLFKISQNPNWKYFTYLWLVSENGKVFIDENKSGSTQEYISLGSLRSIKFMSPPLEILKEFNLAVEGFFNKIFFNVKNIQTLENLRDTLLPKLMSGEVRVNYTPEEIKQ